MFSFWLCGRRKFVLQMTHLVKKTAQADSICLKFSVKKTLWWHGVRLPEESGSIKMVQWWLYLTFASSLGGIVLKENRGFIFFFPHEDICSISGKVRRMVHRRREVVAWNHYFRSQKRKTNASLSCYCLVVFQQKNLQKWGFPWSAHCYFMELRRLQQIRLWRVQSKQSCCPINEEQRFHLEEFYRQYKNILCIEQLTKSIPCHRELVSNSVGSLKQPNNCD